MYFIFFSFYGFILNSYFVFILCHPLDIVEQLQKLTERYESNKKNILSQGCSSRLSMRLKITKQLGIFSPCTKDVLYLVAKKIFVLRSHIKARTHTYTHVYNTLRERRKKKKRNKYNKQTKFTTYATSHTSQTRQARYSTNQYHLFTSNKITQNLNQFQDENFIFISSSSSSSSVY